MSCSGLTRASKNTRHNLTICTQKATRFNKGPRRSRCCGQAGHSLSCSGLFFFLSCSGLTRTSMAPRNALRLPEDDGNASTISAKLSVIPLLSFPCLTRESKKYKARPYDMHAESNALQQRFAPQPLMRSSWLQLARFNKDSYRSH